MTIKEIMNNEELLENIVEDIEDFDENSEVSYEVWVSGYDAEDCVTDVEVLVGEFIDRDQAINCAETISVDDIKAQCGGVDFDDIAYLNIEIETVIDDEEDGIINIGTVYQRELWLGEEDDVIVALNPSEYEVRKDNTLKVKREALLGFNKNDLVMVCLMGSEIEAFPLVYKIVSTVVYEDGDYYHCELEY